MNFLHWKIPGNKGDLVRVNKDIPAFVRLLDPLNFEYYKMGRKFDGKGGWEDAPEVEFDIPYKGAFHVVVDLNGAPGTVRATVDISRR